jgi:hypothetical protein
MHASVWRESIDGSKRVADISRTGTDLSTGAWVELVLLSVIWGGTFFSVAIAQREIGPVIAVLAAAMFLRDEPLRTRKLGGIHTSETLPPGQFAISKLSG